MIPEKRFIVDLEERNIRPFLLSIRSGEAFKISVQFLQGGRPFFGMVEPKLFWQSSSAETGSGWWSKEAFIDDSTGCIYAIFDSAHDADTSINDYVFFLSFKFDTGNSQKGISYCANGRMRILPSPTARPNHLQPPETILDFNDFDKILNAPWLTRHGENYLSQADNWSLIAGGIGSNSEDVSIRLAPEQIELLSYTNSVSVTLDYGSILVGNRFEGRTRFDDRGVSWVERDSKGVALTLADGSPKNKRLEFKDILSTGENIIGDDWSIKVKPREGSPYGLFELTSDHLRFGLGGTEETIYGSGSISYAGNALIFPLSGGGEILTSWSGIRKPRNVSPITPIDVWNATDYEVRTKLNDLIELVNRVFFTPVSEG